MILKDFQGNGFIVEGFTTRGNTLRGSFWCLKFEERQKDEFRSPNEKQTEKFFKIRLVDFLVVYLSLVGI